MTTTPDSPAALLKQAASHMREHHGPGHPRHEFWSELAAWLDVEAGIIERHLPDASGAGIAARRIARAYLDGA